MCTIGRAQGARHLLVRDGRHRAPAQGRGAYSTRHECATAGCYQIRQGLRGYVGYAGLWRSAKGPGRCFPLRAKLEVTPVLGIYNHY